MKTILKTYSWMINTIGRVSIGISPKMREMAMNLSLLLLSFIGIAKYLNDRAKHLLHYHKNSAIILGFVMLLLLLVFCIDRKVDYKNLKCRRGFIAGWLICFILAFVMAFIHPVTKGYFLWTVISLIFAIPFAMIWGGRGNFEYFCNTLARSVFIATTIFCIMNLMLVPYVTNESSVYYLGLVSNTNNNGFICTAGYAAAMFMLLQDRKFYAIYGIVMGFCIAIITASSCRTAELTIAAMTLLGLIYYARTVRNTGENPITKKIAVSLVIVAVIAVAGKGLLLKIDNLDLNSYAYEGEETTEEVIQDSDVSNKLDSLSSGRLTFWKVYIEKSTFWGNGNKTKGPQIAGVEASKYAHNNAIEVLYVSGYIAFAGYVIWITSGMVFVIRCLMGKYGWHKSYIMVVMAFTGYFIQAMLEILIYPMNNIPAMMMYVCLMPIVLDMREEDPSVE